MMQHINQEFDATAGEVVEVTIDRAANVQLLDDANYELYKKDEDYHYEGGYATTSPVRFDVPRDGRWHVVVDLGGGPGHVRASTRISQGMPS